jgi:hypothetical protein
MSEINFHEFTEMKKDMTEMKGNVHKILELLGGNPIDRNDTGHIGIVNDHEQRISNLEKVIERGKWLLIGMTVPSGFGVASIIGYVIDHFK